MKQSSQSKRTSIYSIVGLVVVSAFMSLLLIEVVVYLKPDLIPPVIRTEYFLADSKSFPPGTIPDKNVGFKYAPNISNMEVPYGNKTYFISTVSLGYNDTGFRDDGIDGEPYAIVLGDSVTACVGINQADCWVELLEDKTGTDFANLGVSGYGPDLQFRMFQHYGLPLRPKVVLWVFFANDMIQGWRFNQFGQGAIVEGEFWKNPVRGWLAKHSAIYVTLSYFWYERNFFRHLYAENSPVTGNSTLAWWLAYSDLTVPEVAEGFERSKGLIFQADQELHTELADAKFIVVIIPFREQILYTGTDLQPTFDASSEQLLDFGRQNNISIIDLTPAIRGQWQDEAEQLYFEDSHLTEKGSEVVAEVLAKELEKMLPREK